MCFLRLLIVDNMRKSLQIILFTEKIAFFFFKNMCFQQFLRCCRNGFITSTVIVKIPFWRLQIILWGLSHSIWREQIGQKNFSLEILLSFQNFVLSTTFQVLKKGPYNFNSKCDKSLWTQINCFLRFMTLDETRKNGPKAFVIVKKLIFEVFVSIDFLGPKELILLLPQ